MRAERGLRLLGTRDPMSPARPLFLPEQLRRGCPLFPTWRVAREGKRGTLKTEANFRDKRVRLEGMAPSNGNRF